MGRPGQPSSVLPADGGVARPGRSLGLRLPAARGDRPLRPPARGDRSRPAPVLRDCVPTGWVTALASASRATWAGRRRSRETPNIRPAWRPPISSLRPRSSPSTIPDRAQTVTRNGRVSTFDDLLATLIDIRGKAPQNKGKGLRILTEATTSPTLLRQIGRLARPPSPRPAGSSTSRRVVGPNSDGAQRAFGEAVDPIHPLTTVPT